MTDLETQLRRYGDYLDHLAAATDEDAVTAIELTPMRAPRRWRALAAAAALVVLAGAALVWQHARNTVTPASRPWRPTAWTAVPDLDGVFSPPPGGTARGSGSYERNTTSVSSVVATESGLIAVGTEHVGGGSQPVMWRSEDGTGWTREALTSEVWDGVDPFTLAVWGNALVVLGHEWHGDGEGQVVAVRSDDDGSTWGPLVEPALLTDDEGRLARPAAVAAGDDGLVLFGTAGRLYRTWAWSTRDGVHWERSPVGANGSTVTSAVASSVGIVAAGSDEHHRAAAWFSSDGATWERTDLADVPIRPSHRGQVGAVAAGDGGFVASGWSGDPSLGFMVVGSTVEMEGTGGAPVLWWSADGRSWTVIDAALAPAADVQFLSGPGPVAAGPEGYVAVFPAVDGMSWRTAVYASPDGQTWTPTGTLDGAVIGLTQGREGVAWIAVGTGAFEFGDDGLEPLDPRPSDSGRLWLGS